MKKQLRSGTKGHSFSKCWKMELICVCEYVVAVVQAPLNVILYPTSAIYCYVLVLDIF